MGGYLTTIWNRSQLRRIRMQQQANAFRPVRGAE
jgi:hypothetical protein